MTLPRTPAVAMAATFLLSLFLTAALLLQAGAAPQVLKVGVVDFYAPTPLGSFVEVIPERFAADDLSNLLARSPGGRFDVIPRATMQQAEGAMRWQETDVLHFDRLHALARAVSADRLVVGWIPLLRIDAGGGGPMPLPGEGGGPQGALVNLVVQVFDEAQMRLVAETHPSADITMAANRSLVTTAVLHTALQRALPDVLRALGAQVP